MHYINFVLPMPVLSGQPPSARGGGWAAMCWMLLHTLHFHLSQSSSRLTPWMWHMLSSGCCLHGIVALNRSQTPSCSSSCMEDFPLKLIRTNSINSNKLSLLWMQCASEWDLSCLLTVNTFVMKHWLQSSNGSIFNSKYSQIISKWEKGREI